MKRRGSVNETSGRFPRVAFLIALSVAVSVAECGILDTEIEDAGTIVFSEIEGGCWLIDTATERYFPVNLAENLKVEGLQVEFGAVSRTDVGTFCPGLVIEIKWIGELEAGRR